MAAVNYINSFQISPLTAAALYLLVFYITHSTLSLQHYVHTIKYGMLETRTASLQKCQTPAHDAQSVQVWKIVACLCSPVPSHFAQSLCLTFTPAKKIYTGIPVAPVTNIRYGVNGQANTFALNRCTRGYLLHKVICSTEGSTVAFRHSVCCRKILIINRAGSQNCVQHYWPISSD